MKKTLAIAGAVALAATVGLAAPAQASTKTGGACVQAGLGTLKELGLLQAAAQKQIDYSTLADAENGPILPTSSRARTSRWVRSSSCTPRAPSSSPGAAERTPHEGGRPVS